VSASAFARGKRARPLVYGHRGTRRGAPENTLLAMRRALSQGADGVELDVRLCKSGEVVVVHDADLRRVSGADVVVAEAELRGLEQHDLGDGERVPMLKAALALVLGAGRLLNVELKPDVPDPDALAAAVAASLRALPDEARARVILSSFGPGLCVASRKALPEVPVAFLFERAKGQWPEGIAALHPHHALSDADFVARAHGQGLIVNAWTVNAAERARALSLAGVDGIITDDVPAVLDALSGPTSRWT
jgi:glycerophosphoryl diester phosphodiesterase